MRASITPCDRAEVSPMTLLLTPLSFESLRNGARITHKVSAQIRPEYARRGVSAPVTVWGGVHDCRCALLVVYVCLHQGRTV